MKHNQWKYEQKSAIKTYADIDRELDRAVLHQKFLTEIIGNDKELMKQALSFPNLLQSGISAVMGKKQDENVANLLENNIVFSIAKWIISKII